MCSTMAGRTPGSARAGTIIPSCRSPRLSRPCPARACCCATGLNRSGAANGLIKGIEAIVDQNQLSSAHATFIAPEEIERFRAGGWLIRQGIQYHWTNDGYASFEDFLGALSSRHRKDLRKERARAVEGPGDRPPDRQRPHRSALGRLLALLPGHRQPQMGDALSDARLLLAARRAHGPTGCCSSSRCATANRLRARST